MNVEQIQQIAVIGSGAMGSQIAMVCALAGYSVYLQDTSRESLDKAKSSLEFHMKRRIDKGKLSAREVDEAFSRLNFVMSLEEAVRDTDFVIEAIVEKLEAKRELFAAVDRLAPAHAIIATNSSTIVSSKIADATNRPEQVCNMHFFNPVLVMELVEVVQGPHTSEQTAQTTVELTRRIHKTPILLTTEISGFVANRILGKLMDEALYLLENGIATAEEIDLACTKALNHPIGPFALIDLTGIDVHYLIRMQRYEETGDERAKPSSIVTEKYLKGELGRKTGKGFYTYS
ncbi:3-hydroxyacyl-CoA dehydrogenase family protein [Aneurinibacillus sp. Ricciae_BoGa-3]|uniref:3-hydroxyacyl-CoA dehydrogenase family protein n=1 Tax=Aneurinibacillus sp. Ricciae_BoGa-3 TaxID=3022697 RepID=UPI0023428366|nr:3-hydroxyacyl-CoA dehydrogenase family protein [Aneurinibacillus sp. Ricciae_BoGa-3]WCK52456.1 3-hydroxyacyl-CoA dehydrogenase family protein [Aneurinibacillus sp. Ricciae_BoGa-3]